MCAHHYHYGDGRASSAETYLHRLSGQEREPHIVSMDHSYAKAWNAHPDSHHAKPARLLFMKDVFCSEGKTPEQVAVNVESWKAVAAPPYDGSKTRNLMGECERSAALSARPDSAQWDDGLKRCSWSYAQLRLYVQVTRLLHADRLARLAYKGNVNEPVLRRLAVDRTARRLRRLMGSFGWDMKLLQWLHHLLMEKTGLCYVAAYLDALQALRAQVPQLVDRLVARSGSVGRAADSLGVLLRRPWDPVAPFLSQHKPKRLPCSPLLLVCPGAPVPRAKFWTSQLAVLGKLVSVGSPTASSAGALAPALEAMVAATRAKVLELKSHFPSRPIILIGWMVGGLVACQVSLLESVAAVVCLGFPLVGLSGSRDVDDPLLDSPTATLFVVGQNALSCGMDELENFREHMKAESGLVVVGGADDGLHMCGLKKRLEGVTQAMVDRCVLDEVGAFLHAVLSAPHMGPAGAARQRASPAQARRRGRQCRPYFYQQPGSGGSSSTDTTPGSSPTTILAATGGNDRARCTSGNGISLTLSIGGNPKAPVCLAANAKRGRRVGRPPKQLEKPVRSRPPVPPAVPVRRRIPAAEEPPAGDLMPTSSLWSQSLIDSPPPGGAEQPGGEEGKFVSLAEAGIRTSLLQKRGKPAQKPVCKMLLPASLSMVVASADPPALDSSALEMLAEASSSQAKMAPRATPSRPRVPSSATTRTRKVRVPRFYDS